MSTITTIFFDIGGVLFELRVDQVVAVLAERAGVSRETVQRSFPLVDYYRFERGEIDERQFFTLWRAVLGDTPLTEADCLAAWEFVIGPVLPTVEILEKLLPHYRVWLLSNTNAYHIERLLPQHPFLSKVHGSLFSYQLGCRKPEAQIFRLALERAGTTAAESLFIDDMPDNVKQARRMGITALRFVSPEELEKELRLLGLKRLD